MLRQMGRTEATSSLRARPLNGCLAAFPLTETKSGRARADRYRIFESKRSLISVNHLRVPFAEHLQQPASVVHCVNGVSVIRRFNGIFKPVGDAWICKDFFEIHIQAYYGY